MARKPVIPGDEENKKFFKDEQTDKRIHEHLMNENDEISEADISNVKTDIVPETGENVIPDGEDEAFKERGKERKDKAIRDDSDTDIDTSWNVMDS